MKIYVINSEIKIQYYYLRKPVYALFYVMFGLSVYVYLVPEKSFESLEPKL